MLDPVYFVVSWLLSFWHNAFAALVGDGLAWSLAIAFLVFTVRLVLVKPFVNQTRSSRITASLAPQMAALKKKYAKDKQRLAQEIQKLNKEHGVNPLVGCIPALVQAPVFIGLFHVLRSFDRAGMSPAQNAITPNYAFGAEQVQSFLGADIFGAPLSAIITGGGSSVLVVAIPLMVLAAVATFITTRASIAQQNPEVANSQQGRIMNRLLMFAPLATLIGGPFLPIAILLYFLANNAWTAVQQWVVFRWLGATATNRS